ncbi:MAG TPA: tRNA threonylcarbamoyladenosine dehydratase [Lachnospiraceae bacterium]|nr:tRNA threonylcarbamoyladenosine dehydratase [Lachnospiraceae bacterium]
MDEFSRTRLLIGDAALKKLQRSSVLLFGVGGVGGYAAEALARSGVGSITLVDNDKVSLTNLNRQIIALHSTIDRYKTEVMKERILDINPNAQVNAYNCFFLPENANQFDFTKYDYVIDAVDTVTAKIEIIIQAKNAGTPVISSMGAGNKLDATKLQITDIYQTTMCPLAKVMRKELRLRGVKKLNVVYSIEPVIKPIEAEDVREQSNKRVIPGSIAFIPSVAGLMLAGEVIRDLITNTDEKNLAKD